MGLKKNEKLGDELQFLSAKIALLRSGGFRDRRLNATNTRKHTHTHTHTTATCTEKYLLLNTKSLLKFYYQTTY